MANNGYNFCTHQDDWFKRTVNTCLPISFFSYIYFLISLFILSFLIWVKWVLLLFVFFFCWRLALLEFGRETSHGFGLTTASLDVKITIECLVIQL